MRRCVVLHQAVAADAGADEQDVLAAAAAVSDALRAQDWHVDALAMTLDLGAAAAALGALQPDLVFNLVESLPGLPGRDPLAAAAAALLTAMRLPHTGSGLAAIALTADKPATRRALRQAGIAMPRVPEQGGGGPWIIKHATEHASFGLDAHSVVTALPPALPAGFIAEAFLPGREFNLALLADGADCTVLPLAELVYAADWPGWMPRILDYTGKWDSAHPLHAQTMRRFGTAEPGLAELLAGLARRCWHALGLAGYARLDLRLDAAGMPAVIDVNSNPCLNPDAGLAAAAAEGGMTYEALIARIAAAPFAPVRRPPARAQRRAAEVAMRGELREADVTAIAALCCATGFFTAEEVAVAVELAQDRLARGAASDYRFILAERNGVLAGYACFGRVPMTAAAWDLYWIVADPHGPRHGIGRALLDAVASGVRAAGGTRLYAETAGRARYAPTRRFYAGTGFVLQAVLPDFYASGDDKQIWAYTLI